MILLWGIAADDPLAAVHAALEQQQQPVLFLDQQAMLDTGWHASIGCEVTGTLTVHEETVALDAITAAYLRPYDSRRMLAVERAGPGTTAWTHALSLEESLLAWADLTPALVVNRPAAMASNNSKPYQAALIRAHGFETPDTLITTDPQAALAFWEQHGSVVYKSISGVRSVVSRLRSEHRDRLADIASCPTQLQEYVEGTDYRVHVVDDEIFVCEIRSQSDDYRYAGRDGGTVEIRPSEFAGGPVDRCVGLAEALQLVVAGIDLRRTPDGAWYCFEVNPSPGFTFYEEATDQPISRAIAGVLARGRATA